MKKIPLFFTLFIATYSSYAQGALVFYIDFDSGYVAPKYMATYGYTYFNDSSWLYIDTTDYHRNQWQVGRPQKVVFDSAYSYPNAIVTDTLHPCLPNDTSVFVLKMPKDPWLGLHALTLHYKLDIDTGDIAMMEWANDSGLHWTNILTDTNGLFYFAPGNIPNLSLSTHGWATMNLNPKYPPWETLNPTDSLLMRFTFITDSSTTPRDGWMIDNFSISYDGEGVPVISSNASNAFYPNPTHSLLNVSARQPIKDITITNFLGQQVYSKDYNTDKVQVNVSTLPSGIYIVKINGVEAQTFIKE